MRPAVLARLVAALLALLVAGCGSLLDMGGDKIVDPRRAYVNDHARNDSLAVALPGRGLLFVLQPGETYDLRMYTQAEGQKLDFYAPSGNSFVLKESVAGTRTGGLVSFPVAPTKTTTDYYLAFLRAAGGGRASAPDSGVRLVPRDTSSSTTVAVRLLMVRQLKSRLVPGSMGAIEKSEYARSFHVELKSVYAAHGITLDTSSIVVEPEGAPFAIDFGAPSVSIPGDRLGGAINIYLVDNIEYEGEGIILGFAPREAFDLSGDLESRVILNVRGGPPASMAVTAAHEMGHFLGLRHTSATALDRSYDDDDSNRDDGFASTSYCSALQKMAVGPTEITRLRSGQPYCLRVAGTAITCDCTDNSNLMYPYACPVTQKSLGADQRAFLRNNLRVYQ
jgi:hypothetical protein